MIANPRTTKKGCKSLHWPQYQEAAAVTVFAAVCLMVGFVAFVAVTVVVVAVVVISIDAIVEGMSTRKLVAAQGTAETLNQNG